MDQLVKIPADQIGNSAKRRLSHRIDVGDAEILIDQIDAERRVVQQALDLRHASAGRLARLRAVPLRIDTRQQIPGRKGLDEIVVGAGRNAFEGGLLAGPSPRAGSRGRCA